MAELGYCETCKWYEPGIHLERHDLYGAWKIELVGDDPDIPGQVIAADEHGGWCHGSTPPWRGTNIAGFCRLYEKKTP